MLTEVASRMIRHTLGAKAGQLVDTPEVEIINHVSESFARMRQWNFLQQRTAPLSMYKGEALIPMPDDFGEAISLESSQGGAKLSWMELVTPGRLLAVRSSVIAQVSTYFATVVDKPRASRNLLGYSEAFNNPVWLSNLVTVTPNTSLAPNGTTTMDTLSATGPTGSVRQDIDKTRLKSGQTYGFSVFLRAGTSTKTSIMITQGGLSLVAETSARTPLTLAQVTWSAGVGSIALVTGQGNGAHDFGIESIGDSIYRAWVTFTYDDDAAKASDELQASVFPSLAANSTSIAWGAQVELLEASGPDVTPEPSRYEPSLADFVALKPKSRRVLEIWPTPSVDKLQAFRIFYRAKIPRVVDLATDEIVIPTFCDDVYLELCRIYARGYHEEDEGMLHERIQSLKASEFFADAVDYDDGQQYELGQLSGCAADTIPARNWNTDRVPAPNED